MTTAKGAVRESRDCSRMSRERSSNPTDTGPALTPVEMNLHRQDDPATGIVVTNEICTGKKSSGFVRHLAFDVSGSRLENNFVPGQSFGVLPEGLNERGQPHAQRLYSIASPSRGEDGQGKVIATTVKRFIDEHWDTGKLMTGVASNYLCDLEIGQEVKLLGPSGKRFVLPEKHDEFDYLFFATGTGIAPFRGMLEELFHLGAPRSATLVMGVPYATDLIYHDHFVKLQDEQERFTYLTAISRERQEDAGQGLYVQDRLRTHRDEMTELLARPTTIVYICGILGMEIGIFQQMARLLPPEILSNYLRVDAEVAGDIESWTRRMLHRKLKPTRRVFIEVY